MKQISKSKRQLAQLLIEAGVTRFPEGANWAAQDKQWAQYTKCAMFYRGADKPEVYKGDMTWRPSGDDSFLLDKVKPIALASLIPNWHQTVLSRVEFDQIVAETAPDAYGWIKWSGGECPVDDNCKVSIRVRGDSGSARGKAKNWSWGHSGDGSDIIAYRLHKPEQAQLQFPVEMAFDKIQKGVKTETKPTIEQLAADYRNSKDCADRKQQEADAAKADAESKLAELIAAGKALNLVISVAEEDPELVIAELTDLKIGDEVDATYRGIERVVGRVTKIDFGDKNQPVCVSDGERSIWATEWKFIRRP